MRTLAIVSCLTILALAPAAHAQDSLLLDGFESLDGWATGGQKEISFELSDRHVTQGKHSLHIHVEIDHENAEEVKKVKYPMGWPSVRKTWETPVDLSEYDFIEFDVYFESERHVDPDFAMHVTAKGGEARGIYRVTVCDLRDRKSTPQRYCIRDIPAAAAFNYISFWLSESTYDDGAVIDFYIDNLRATRAADYVPPQAHEVRHALARADFGTLWMEGSCRKIQRAEQVVLPEGTDPVVRMFSARNETEAVQLVVTPTGEGVGEVSLEVGALTGPGGAVIAAENVFWSQVYNVPANEGPPEGLPDALPGPKPFAADGPGNWPIWLEVYVPAETPAGDYSAPVTVHTGSGDITCELALRVWDFDLPVKQSLRTSTTIYGAWGWSDEIKGWFGNPEYWPFLHEIEPEFVKYLARCRLSPSGIGNLPMKWDEEKGEVVIGDTTDFEKYAQMYLDMGHHMDHMPVPYFFDRSSFLGAKKGTPEYLERIGKAYKVAAEWLERKGWLDDCYVYCVDEVVVHKNTTVRDLDLLNRVFDTIHAAHPKIRIFGAESPSPILRGMNVWCVNMDSFSLALLEEQHALGNGVWWYNGYKSPRPGMRIATRAVDHRIIGWMSYKYGIDGYLIWTINRWVANPWEEPNRGKSSAGSYFLLYPNPDGTFSPSLRIVMLRDGFE
ncbi:MAG: DUF4091 domain-containing protein, partial [Armatimonadetes bacterium]|nr:DUF4091 domain-containing protein [Armatimonadota bacterium]